MRVPGDFHPVRFGNGGRTITYAIYCNNKLYLKPPRGKKLSRRNAFALCDFFNSVSSERLVKRAS